MQTKELNLVSYFRGEVSEERIANYLLATTYLHYKPNGKFYEGAKSLVSDLAEKQRETLYEFVGQFNDVKYIIDLYYSIKRKYAKYTGSISANFQVNQLITKLLKLDNNETIFDLCSGDGEFLFEAYKQYDKSVTYKGMEINSAYNLMGQLIFDLLNVNYNFENGNALFDNYDNYDKGFVFPPFGMKYTDDTYQKFLTVNKSLFNSRTTSEWFFVDRLINKMNDNGRSIALLCGKPLFSAADTEYRNYLLDNKLVEGIIELPAGVLLPFTGIQTTILIFSNNNENIKVIDRNLYSSKNKKSKEIEMDINSLVNDYFDGKCTLLSNNEVKEKNTFVVSNLTSKPKEIKFAKVLSSVANISQGSQYTISNFKERITEEKTNYRILTSSEIDNGYINWDALLNIKNDDVKLLKHRLQKNDLVMTSKSSKVKIAVVDFEPEDNVIVTGGMFIIRPNTEEINPVFLKMFFESNVGVELLKSIQKGSIIPTIPTGLLRELIISCPPIEEQNLFAKKYNSKLNMYIAIKKELEELEYTIKNFYESIIEE